MFDPGFGLKVTGFDVNEMTPQFEPPACLRSINICNVANWCLRLPMDGREAAGTKNHFADNALSRPGISPAPARTVMLDPLKSLPIGWYLPPRCFDRNISTME